MIFSFLDSYIFACPNEPSEDDIVTLIRSLIHWRDLEQARWMKTFVCSQAVDTLARAGCGFPPWHVVSESIRHRQIDLDPRDVHLLMQSLIDRLPKIEEDLGINEILIDKASCDPDLSKNRGDVFKDDFARLLALVSLFRDRSNDKQMENQFVVLSRGLPLCPTTVVFSAMLEEIDPDTAVEVPRQLNLTTQVFQCPTHHAEILDPLSIWMAATTDEELVAAIRIYSERAAHFAAVGQAIDWQVGAHFGSSVTSKYLTTKHAAKLTLRACSETILNLNLAATHHLRESKAANAAQVQRGPDRGWKRDIDNELHLLFWVTPTGIEFSKIAMHRDNVIE